MSRAYRRFEERKRRLKRINEVYKWGYTDWDGKYIRRNWDRYYWCRIEGEIEPPIKYWKNMRMGETGHSAWVNTFMNRPARSMDKRLTKSIAAGRIEPDGAMFSIHGKPWIYYW